MKKITIAIFSMFFICGFATSQTRQNSSINESDSTAISPKKNTEIKKGITIDRSTMKTVTIAPAPVPTLAPAVKEEEATPTTPIKNQPKKK
jgi:hypothetical protein